MSEEDTEDEGKKKSPIVKMILIFLGLSIVVGITVTATLFATGYFDAGKEEDAEQALAELEAQAAEANEAALAALETLAAQASASEKVQLDNPELSQFQQSYYQFDKKLTSKVANSRKVMQVSVAIMTHYDDRVVANVEKHVFALRNVMLMVMQQQTEADLADPELRIKLAEEFKFVMNAELEALEDFGGIEQVYLTEFVVQ